ncbi:hypothetical protein HPB50_009762 [Hyalomma asiaticum]|uniref:Uncharacterized protein n=1 Tax=Hyalomma asiaticum TaxID=266040 RepID=A0ACB7S2K7_HYAAI|nr:hypothetical protein HPB50_009762 [Hyalomma asiaticum]
MGSLPGPRRKNTRCEESNPTCVGHDVGPRTATDCCCQGTIRIPDERASNTRDDALSYTASVAPCKVSVRRELVLFAKGRSEGEEATRSDDGREGRSRSQKSGTAGMPGASTCSQRTRNHWKTRRRCSAKVHQRTGTRVIRTGQGFGAQLCPRITRQSFDRRRQSLSVAFITPTPRPAETLGPHPTPWTFHSGKNERRQDPTDGTIHSQADRPSIPRHAHTRTHTQRASQSDAAASTKANERAPHPLRWWTTGRSRSKAGWRGRQTRNGACREKLREVERSVASVPPSPGAAWHYRASEFSRNPAPRSMFSQLNF